MDIFNKIPFLFLNYSLSLTETAKTGGVSVTKMNTFILYYAQLALSLTKSTPENRPIGLDSALIGLF